MLRQTCAYDKYIDRYVKELGLMLDSYGSQILSRDEPYYRARIKVGDEWVTVVEKDVKYMPHSSILGMTWPFAPKGEKEIWMQKGLGYMREAVLRHEIAHIVYPFRSEREIREMTYT